MDGWSGKADTMESDRNEEKLEFHIKFIEKRWIIVKHKERKLKVVF